MADKPKTEHKGRSKGTPNKITSVIRDRIHAADPLGLLINALQSGRIENVNDEGKPDGTYEDLTPATRIRIAETLIKKYIPDAKDRTVHFDIDAIKDVGDATEALGQIIKAVSQGDLTPSEGSQISSTINGYVRVFEVSEMQVRMDKLEAIFEEVSK